MSASPSWYDVLDVDPTADADEVRAAWKAAIADLEPTDRRFQTLNRAAEVLLDPTRRAAYDAELAEAEEPDLGFEARAPERPRTSTGGPEAPERPRTSTGGPASAHTSTGVSGWLLVALAAAVLTVAGAAAALFLLRGGSDSEESAAAAQKAAEEAIVPILSYDYRHLDQDRAAAQSYLTSKYKPLYDKTFSIVEENAGSVQPVVVAKLVSSGLARSGDDRVEVVLFVDQETTNKETTEPVVYQNYVTVTMQDVDGEWLVDELQTQG
ncbi:J domain-containing protein [Nocardioides sp. LHG3406-4]|uniref:J domain-containing protein n=1 Tax=Nocardioides sp. LHG3406-4 TaxID=2804575 RepID=UPI003CE7555C